MVELDSFLETGGLLPEGCVWFGRDGALLMGLAVPGFHIMGARDAIEWGGVWTAASGERTFVFGGEI